MKNLFFCVVCICINLRQSAGHSDLGCCGRRCAFCAFWRLKFMADCLPPPPGPVGPIVTRTILAYKRKRSREKRGFLRILARPSSLDTCTTCKPIENRKNIRTGPPQAKHGTIPIPNGEISRNTRSPSMVLPFLGSARAPARSGRRPRRPHFRKEKSRPEGVKRILTGEGAGQHTRGAYAPPDNSSQAQC
jgi:hypothetical protein